MTFDHRTQQSKCTSKGYVSLGICIGWTQQEVRRWRRHWHSPCGSAPRQSAGWRSVHSGSGEVSVLLVLLWHPYRFFSLHSNLPFWSLFSACFIKVLFLYFSFLAIFGTSFFSHLSLHYLINFTLSCSSSGYHRDWTYVLTSIWTHI